MAAAPAPERTPEPRLEPLLQPLQRSWQSRLLGYIQVRIAFARGELLERELDVCVPGGGLPFANVLLERLEGAQSLRLELWRAARRERPELPADPILLSKDLSSRKRVVWQSHGNIVDVWEGNLLDAAERSAQHVVSVENLGYDLERALAMLDTVTALPPRIAQPWLPGQTSVGLCVTAFNRFWQLQHALPLNLLMLWPHRSYAKLHLVLFKPDDGSLDFVFSKCRAALDVGLLKVYVTDQMEAWHASVAKNTAHMVAEEDILVNCDVDNLFCVDFPFDIIKRMAAGKSLLHYEDGEGTCGRIALRREHFHTLRGYDEDAFPMGAQDVDLIFRMKQLLGADCYQKVRGHSQAIKNSIKQKVENCSRAYGNLRWGQMDSYNRWLFEERRAAGLLRRNLERTSLGVPCQRVMPA